MRVHIECEDISVPGDAIDAYEVIYLNALLDEFETVDLVVSWVAPNIDDVGSSANGSSDCVDHRSQTNGEVDSTREAANSNVLNQNQVQARFVGVPYYGEPTVIETRGGDALGAIENCFARTRRAILRQHRLASLAS